MDYKTIVIRLLVAVLVGGLVGYEREHKDSPAGFRTHILVCVGAAIISLISENNLQRAMELAQIQAYENIIKIDMGRLGAQVVSGIGFLGAGTILRDRGSVRGLTTAATLWLVACLGLAVGQGLYSLALTGAFIVFITLSLFKKADKFINKRKGKASKEKKEKRRDEVYSDNEETGN